MAARHDCRTNHYPGKYFTRFPNLEVIAIRYRERTYRGTSGSSYDLLMSGLIVAGIALTILLLSVMLSKKNKLFADKFLILYLSFAVVRQIYVYIETTGILEHSYWMLMGKGLYLLNGPLFFLYIYTLTQQKKPARRYYVILFFPFAAYFLHFLYYYFFILNHVQLTINNGLLEVNGEIAWSWSFFVLLFILIDPVYIIWFYLLLRKYKRKVLDNVSSNYGSHLNWLTVLFYLWLVSAVVLVPFSILTVGRGLFSTASLQILVELCSVIFFFIVGFYGFRQTAIFTNLDLERPPVEKKSALSYERSGLTQDQLKTYHTRLLLLMEENKPYLNGELSAGELARLAGITVNHLSQVLNNEQHQNFFDFVNGYRVNEVISKMKNPKFSHLTLLALGLESGFNSKTSFNTIFKKITHQTPSEYYKKLK